MARLMLVDDEPEVVSLLSLILTMYGFEVSGYTDAATAINDARQVRPDLLLVDLIMPGMDGIGLVKALDEIPDLAGTPVLMLTGMAAGELTMDGGMIHGPGIGILEKPCDPEKIVAEVTRLLAEQLSQPGLRAAVVNTRRSLTATHGSPGLSPLSMPFSLPIMTSPVEPELRSSIGDHRKHIDGEVA